MLVGDATLSWSGDGVPSVPALLDFPASDALLLFCRDAGLERTSSFSLLFWLSLLEIVSASVWVFSLLIPFITVFCSSEEGGRDLGVGDPLEGASRPNFVNSGPSTSSIVARFFSLFLRVFVPSLS